MASAASETEALMPLSTARIMYRRQASWVGSVHSDSPYPGTPSSPPSLQARYSLGPDPNQWGCSLDEEDPDDDIHGTGAASTRGIERDGNAMSLRGMINIGCLLVLIVGLLVLFIGYPVMSYARDGNEREGFNLAGRNATGQVPGIPGNWALIDADTPVEAYTKASWTGQEHLQLVFSDEFNVDGRTFYPGDDPWWEAVDLHYWATNNLEWYDPEAIITSNGSLVITLSQKDTHNLNYQGGLLSTWNKFCFTGGYVETSVKLPGANNIVGLWPAVWTMGNLGRAGYGASLEGMWPYTYDACDVGTAPNQTLNRQPYAATINGDHGKGGALSWLPGQRLSRCTCSGESHPGPVHTDGTFVGRSAPEIDIFEAQITGKKLIAQVSQSAQWAPFDAGYHWQNTSENFILGDPSISGLNNFVGSATQQATSVLTNTNLSCYEQSPESCFAIYGFEYKPGFDDGYITWIANNQISWTIRSGGVGQDDTVLISARPIPMEPLYLLANLGMSYNFGSVDLAHLPFPCHLQIDYVRVYQPKNAINYGCNPHDFPTSDYINTYIEAYTNPNLTTWRGDYGQPFPKSSFLGEC